MNEQPLSSAEPLWRKNVDLPKFDKLNESVKTDVCVVGGGITGITTAYLLAKEGVKVILIDADNILNGTTGHTTAKITEQHGLIYDELIKNLGEEVALKYNQAAKEANDFIKNTIQQFDISCGYEEQDAYLYTNDYYYVDKIENEFKAYNTLDIKGELVDKLPIELPIKKGLLMPGQAQFHPLKYLQFLLHDAINNGLEVYEHTVAMEVERNKHTTVITKDDHRITCNYVVSASHFPFHDDEGLYFTRMYAERSYVIAGKTNSKINGMYINVESATRSVRSVTIDNEDYIVIAGENHRAGQGKSSIAHYEELQSFAKKYFDIDHIAYRWSAQDLTTLDKLPYIGPITDGDPSILIATGYRKWGMTNGTLAANVLASYILKHENNRYRELLSPSRFKADPMIKNLFTVNANTAKEFIKGKFSFTDNTKIDDLNQDEATITHNKGIRIGVYKDNQDNIYSVDTTCTHLGCEVNWNQEDRTWDCPCHGSRYNYTGEVIEGPAKQSLKNISLGD
ncbi:FAD-dependent oxidoreductase [Oceanobacillus sp. 1P07AA]|uniref:FAD-dependent oxidoreductase n=1 Tax=Oceanobacillus sp. 1P07AA TaxID=3132293 RepID=UPI0039A57D7A